MDEGFRRKDDRARRPVNSDAGGAIRAMTRNWKLLLVVVSGLGICALSELFPAWQYIDGNTSAVRSAGYHLYNSPPSVKSTAEMKKLFHWEDRDLPMAIRVRRDYFQSFSQRVVVAWLTIIGLILSFGHGPLLLRIVLWMFFAFGATIAALLLWRVLG